MIYIVKKSDFFCIFFDFRLYYMYGFYIIISKLMKRKILSYLLCWILSLFILNVAIAQEEDVPGANITPGDLNVGGGPAISTPQFTQEGTPSQEELEGLKKKTDEAQWKWVKTDKPCLYWVWKWCFDYEMMVFPSSNLDNVNEHKTVLTVLQDVVLWATFMVWTVLMIVIIYCGLMYIFAAWDGKDPNKYKDYLINAAIWALFVWWGYAIVRLIQYIAKW